MSIANSKQRQFASLDSFVVGECNNFAFTAAQQFCHHPDELSNSLFIHGGVGTGKTHLMEGIYKLLRGRYPALEVMFVSSEQFANHFTRALRERTIPSFRARFRNVDVLLIDDVDFFDTKKGFQEELLHTMRQIEQTGRRIILSGDRHPRLLNKFPDELTTRFMSGVTCKLQTPDVATRQKIVQAKADRLKLPLTTETVRYVAKKFQRNVRELLGAVYILQTFCLMTRKRLSTSEAKSVLLDHYRDCVKAVSLADIEQAVSEFFGLSDSAIRSAERTRHVSQPRMLAMYLSRRLTRMAYSDIGKHFGGRNHSTVMSAEKKVNGWIKSDEPIQIGDRKVSIADVVGNLEQSLIA